MMKALFLLSLLFAVAGATTVNRFKAGVTYPANFPATLDGSVIWVKRVPALTTAGAGQFDTLCRNWNGVTFPNVAAATANVKALICDSSRTYWNTVTYGALPGGATQNTPSAGQFQAPVYAFDILATTGGQYHSIAPNPNSLFNLGLTKTLANQFPAFSNDIVVPGTHTTEASFNGVVADNTAWNGCKADGTAATNTCNNWSSISPTIFGANGNPDSIVYPFTTPNLSGQRWLVSTNSGQCDQTQRWVYCIYQPACNDGVWNGDETGIDCGGRCPSCTPVGIVGDPQIYGIQGQEFQVHGEPNEYFNLVSTPTLQLNSRFVFLKSAECPDNFTQCFSHEGTYMDILGLQVQDGEKVVKAKIVAGSHHQGLTVEVDKKAVHIGARLNLPNGGHLKFVSKRQVIILVDKFQFTVSLSDKFFNVQTSLTDLELSKLGAERQFVPDGKIMHSTVQIHGLIGQTWKNAEYEGGKVMQGSVQDYLVTDGIWGTNFQYNIFHN